MVNGDSIPRREIDARPIVGAAVVFLIIGAIIFGVFYFFIFKPSADALEASKLSAMSQVNSLSSIGTSHAISDASTYSAQIQSAVSITEVESIRVEVTTAIQREEKRDELLEKADNAANGSFYSATGTGTTQQEENLSTLLQTLQTEIKGKNTLAELQSYEASGTIDSQATAAWQTFLTSLVNGIQNDNLVMKSESPSNSPTSWYFKTKTDALAYVAESTLRTLRELDFEGTNYLEIPISDTVNRGPTISSGSQVNLYVYDTAVGSLHLITGNATVSRILYSKADIATVAWTMSTGTTSQSYATNIWETLKAVAAGSSDAASVGWQNYGDEVMSNALSADVLDFSVNAIYVVRVPTEAGESIIQYEFHQSATKDVILVAQTT